MLRYGPTLGLLLSNCCNRLGIWSSEASHADFINVIQLDVLDFVTVLSR